MPTKTGGVKITFKCALSLRKRFNKHCKKEGISAAHWFRDAMQKELKVSS